MELMVVVVAEAYLHFPGYGFGGTKQSVIFHRDENWYGKTTESNAKNTSGEFHIEIS